MAVVVVNQQKLTVIMVMMVRVADTGRNSCLVKSCYTVICRTGGLVKESYLEIPTVDCAVIS